MTSKPVLLILGAGSNIGKALTTRFAAAGFLIAAVSRNREDKLTSQNHLDIRADLTDTNSIPDIFHKVRSTLGPPSVVVYNACSRTMTDATDPLASFSLPQYQEDMTLNTTNAIQAAYHAIEGFKQLPASHLKTFIYTGNKLNVMPSPYAPVFGMGKTAMAHLIWSLNEGYRKAEFKFYFTDERYADGSPVRAEISGEARSDICLELAQDGEQRAWNQTFIKDQGYFDFGEIDWANIVEGTYA